VAGEDAAAVDADGEPRAGVLIVAAAQHVTPNLRATLAHGQR
jgi:hypothetical protein